MPNIALSKPTYVAISILRLGLNPFSITARSLLDMHVIHVSIIHRVVSLFVVVLILYIPVNTFSIMPRHFPVSQGWTGTKQRIIKCRSRTQHSASDEYRNSWVRDLKFGQIPSSTSILCVYEQRGIAESAHMHRLN